MYTMDKSYEPSNDSIFIEGFSSPDKQERSTGSKTLPLEDMERFALPSLNNQDFAYVDDVDNCKIAKAFQAEGNLETLIKFQTDDPTTTYDFKSVDNHVGSIQGLCAVEVSYEEKEERRNLSDSAIEAFCEETDFGIQIRGKFSQSESEVEHRRYSRQSSVINLKEDKKKLLNGNVENVVGEKGAKVFNNEPPGQLVEPEKEKRDLLNEPNDDGLVNFQAKRDEEKFGEQPQTLIEGDFVSLAISQTKEDIIRQETIHLDEQQVFDEGDFVSLRSANKKGPRKVREIGRGAFGICFQVEYVSKTGRKVNLAIKEIENKGSNTEDNRRAEYLMLRELNHQNIVRCFWGSFDPLKNKYSFAMEYMPGGSVADLLREYSRGFNEELIKFYIVQLLQGLEYLHSKRILHRDLKGENLLLCENYYDLKICDFGCAIYVDCIELGYTDTKLRGTVPFMAPEVIKRYSYSAASDVWSMGCCIIQMATGQLPWNANRNEELTVMYKIGKATDPPPIPDCLSTALQSLTRQCLFIDKAKRLSAGELRFQKAVVPDM